MRAASSERNLTVAHLRIGCARHRTHHAGGLTVPPVRQRRATYFRSDALCIQANKEFEFGRRHVQNACEDESRTISTHHLRFRCVYYDDDAEYRVAPLVYVRVVSSNPVRVHHFNSDGEKFGHLVSRDDGDRLLNEADTLQLTQDISLTFRYTRAYASWDDSLCGTQRTEAMLFHDQYAVSGRKLGGGGQASVFFAVKQKTQRQLACKIISRPQSLSAVAAKLDRRSPSLGPAQREVHLRKAQEALHVRQQRLAREYDILRDLSHPNIVSLERVICSPNNIYIFQELVAGGDLLSYIDQKGELNEPEAAMIIFQLTKAVEYLHSASIVHRDIKPENILMSSWRPGARVVLTDFGQARKLGSTDTETKTSAVARMQTLVGTHGYTAP